MTQDNIRTTVNQAAETMLLLLNKFNKDGAESINTLAVAMKAISHILTDQLNEYNDINNPQQWVMRSADTGEVWGRFTNLTEAIDAKMRYEKMDIIEGIYRVDMYLISQEPINTK
jgi:uncharacterized protein YigE (DUF2233 family)